MKLMNDLLHTPACEDVRRELIENLCAEYSCVTKKVIGQSECGRDIDALCFGTQDHVVLFAGAFHGLEWITSLVLLDFARKIAEAVNTSESIGGIKIGRFLKRRGLVIIPCMNPDGVEIAINGVETAGKYSDLVQSICNGDLSIWQANARGVDLNHNYNAEWDALHELERKNGITKPNYTRFGGEKPESELETKALCEYCRNQNIRHAVAFHSQGEEIYYDFGNKTPERSLHMAQVMASVCGYTVSKPEGLALGGGFKDWFISEFGKPGFTLELGKGKNPLPIEDLDGIIAKIEDMLALCTIM
ncbi:MAG: M14 family metallocarboxypeptidase [Bacillota bacterium]|nr:M14 family metallocarboxypeptidase [Bacillota bacterium]